MVPMLTCDAAGAVATLGWGRSGSWRSGTSWGTGAGGSNCSGNDGVSGLFPGAGGRVSGCGGGGETCGGSAVGVTGRACGACTMRGAATRSTVGGAKRVAGVGRSGGGAGSILGPGLTASGGGAGANRAGGCESGCATGRSSTFTSRLELVGTGWAGSPGTSSRVCRGGSCRMPGEVVFVQLTASPPGSVGSGPSGSPTVGSNSGRTGCSCGPRADAAPTSRDR
ncbi:hypothetical protein MAUB1S_02898 [Mycolicibacterium aubagnense]